MPDRLKRQQAVQSGKAAGLTQRQTAAQLQLAKSTVADLERLTLHLRAIAGHIGPGSALPSSANNGTVESPPEEAGSSSRSREGGSDNERFRPLSARSLIP